MGLADGYIMWTTLGTILGELSVSTGLSEGALLGYADFPIVGLVLGSMLSFRDMDGASLSTPLGLGEGISLEYPLGCKDGSKLGCAECWVLGTILDCIVGSELALMLGASLGAGLG